MLARLAAAALLFSALCAQAQIQHDDDDGDVLTAHDGQGNITTVYNRFDGQTHSIQITRLTSQGAMVWNYQHVDNYYEKAYSVSMDSAGNIFITGVRNLQGRRYFWLMKYTDTGYLSWENVDNEFNCAATGISLDSQNNAIVGGVCRSGNFYPARIVKYNNDGAYLWSQDYDAGGRNYVRALQIDLQDNISLSVETVAGNFRDGSYTNRTLIYSPNGQLLETQ